MLHTRTHTKIVRRLSPRRPVLPIQCEARSPTTPASHHTLTQPGLENMFAIGYPTHCKTERQKSTDSSEIAFMLILYFDITARVTVSFIFIIPFLF